MEYKFLIFSFEHKVLKAMLSNRGQLLAIIAYGIPNQQMMFFQRNSETYLSLMVAYASTSTHLLK